MNDAKFLQARANPALCTLLRIDVVLMLIATLTKGIISRETGTDAHTAEHVFIIMCMPGQL